MKLVTYGKQAICTARVTNKFSASKPFSQVINPTYINLEQKKISDYIVSQPV